MKPKITVLMSSFNTGAYLEEAVQSILNQTFTDFEVIVFEDGSKDDSAEVLKRLEKQDQRVVAVYNTENIGYKGFIINLSKGIKMAKGKYIARMDTDDIALPTRLQKQYDFLESNPEIFLIGTGAINMNADGSYISTFKPETNPESIAQTLPYRNHFFHPSIMFRNEDGLAYREKFLYCEDYDFYLRALSSGKKLSNIEEPLIRYRVHANSFSNTKTVYQALLAQKGADFYFQRLEKGSDDYESFNPQDILDMDLENSTDKVVLEKRIRIEFKQDKFASVRKLAMKYFKLYGFNKSIAIFFVTSFGGVFLINKMRRLLRP